MTADEIKAKLNQLAEYQSQIDAAALAKQALIDGVMTPEIRKQIEDIEAEFRDKTIAAVLAQTALETEIKVAVKALGESIKGEHLHAVFAKGRTSWDTKKLEGLMMVVPQLQDARTIGDASVSIRKIG